MQRWHQLIWPEKINLVCFGNEYASYIFVMFYVEFVKKQERRAPLWPAAMSTTVKIFLFVGSLLHTLDLLRTKILGQVKTPSGRPRNPSSLLSATPSRAASGSPHDLHHTSPPAPPPKGVANSLAYSPAYVDRREKWYCKKISIAGIYGICSWEASYRTACETNEDFWFCRFLSPPPKLQSDIS